MANHTFKGIKVTGSLAAGTASFDSAVSYLWYTRDIFTVIFYDSGERIDGELVTNEFDMRDKRLSFPLPHDQILSDGGDFDQRYAFELNFGGGQVTQILQLYDSASDTSYLFALGGTETDLPDDQASLTAWLGNIDSSNAFDNPNQLFDLRAAPHIATRDRDFYTVSENYPVRMDFGTGNDVLYVETGGATIGAGAGNDVLIALPGADGSTLIGNEGNDYIKFRDFVMGGASGEAGDDRIIGNDNLQTFYGGEGSDVLIGLGGFDTLFGEAGDDFVYGGRDNDVVTGGDGNDVVRGNRGNDLLIGDDGTAGDGSDRIYGGGGNDELRGGGARDFLLGENGNDFLDGGAGDDNLSGGAGRDTFAYNWWSFDTYSHGFDRILDFEDGLDLIDLRVSTFSDAADVIALASDTGSGMRIRFDAGDVLFLDGMSVAQLDASDFLFN